MRRAGPAQAGEPLMSDIAIRVEGLSKRYRIGEVQQRYRTLRDTLASGFKAPLRAIRAGFSRNGRKSPDDNTIWALKDLGFEIKAGETIGIIGRNGAGKSTLLKVLSRITEPTTGYAEIHGRIGSLLEVGTGFHNELTGRENIFLNGAILGMKRADIQRQFDDIVAFAEVEKFVDTAVKHYSSGMYLRLAFAVAAHLEPETLLVDEVLAVGDVAFQKKCLGKMGEVAKQGRTVLFVSHNMGAIRSLCEKGMVLHNGGLVEFGDVGRAIETYYRLAAAFDAREPGSRIPASGFGFEPVELVSHKSRTIEQSEGFEVSTVFHIGSEVGGFTLLCQMEDMHQRSVFHLRQESLNFSQASAWKGAYEFRVKLPPLWLEPGMYSLYFKILLRGQLSSARYVSDMLNLDIGGECSGWGAVLTPRAEWEVAPIGTGTIQACPTL